MAVPDGLTLFTEDWELSSRGWGGTVAVPVTVVAVPVKLRVSPVSLASGWDSQTGVSVPLGARDLSLWLPLVCPHRSPLCLFRCTGGCAHVEGHM